MKRDIVKIMKVVEELGTCFLHTYRASSLDIKLLRGDDAFTVHLSFAGVHLEPAELANLQREFSQSRSPELEDYYWQLSGDRESSSALSLVAMMCDSITLRYDEPVLTLDLVRRL